MRVPSKSYTVAGVLALALLQPLQSAAAQCRDCLLHGILAYQRADFALAIPLLSRGLDPSAGPRDEMWAFGLHALIESVLAAEDREQADVWLAWAFEVEPGLEPDSANFPPAVVEAMRDAQQRQAMPFETNWSVVTRWAWGVPGFRERHGVLIVNLEPQSTQIRRDGTHLEPGAATRLPVGIHTLAVGDSLSGESGLIRVAILPALTVEVTIILSQLALARGPVGRTLTAFLQAVQRKDWSVAASLRTRVFGPNPNNFERSPFVRNDSFEIGEQKVWDDGRTVTVQVLMRLQNCEARVPFTLTEASGAWLIQTLDLGRAADLSRPPFRYPDNCR